MRCTIERVGRETFKRVYHKGADPVERVEIPAVRVRKLDLVWSLIFRLPVYARPVRGA